MCEPLAEAGFRSATGCRLRLIIVANPRALDRVSCGALHLHTVELRQNQTKQVLSYHPNCVVAPVSGFENVLVARA